MRRTGWGTDVLLLAALLSAAVQPAGAWVVTCTNCANLAGQAVEKAQVTVSAVESVQQTIEQIRMVQHMAANLERYGTTPLGLRHAQATLRHLFASLKATTANGMDVANVMNNLLGEYGGQYRDFAFEAQAQRQVWQNGTPDRAQWDARYQAWLEQTHRKVLTPLETAKALDAQMGDSEDQRMAQLEGQLSGAEGESRLLESLAGLIALQIEQMQKLRGLMVLEMESNALWRAALMERMTGEAVAASIDREPPTGIDPTFNRGLSWSGTVR